MMMVLPVPANREKKKNRRAAVTKSINRLIREAVEMMMEMSLWVENNAPLLSDL